MIEQAILALCINMQTPELSKYYESCKQILTAASIQTRLKPDVEMYQQTIEQMVAKQTGEGIWVMSGFVYTMYTKNKLLFNFPIRPVADNMILELNQTTQNVALSWSL